MKINDVLIPLDFSDASLFALDFAIELMEGRGEVMLLHVVEERFIERVATADLGMPREELLRRLTDSAERRLAEIAARYDGADLAVKTLVVAGEPFLKIIQLSRELSYQAVLMGVRGRFVDTIAEALFGSTAERVLRGAQLPVITVPYDPRSSSRSKDS